MIAVRISDADDHYACDPADCPDAVQTGRRIVGDLADVQYDAACAAYEEDQASLTTRPQPSEGGADRG